MGKENSSRGIKRAEEWPSVCLGVLLAMAVVPPPGDAWGRDRSVAPNAEMASGWDVWDIRHRALDMSDPALPVEIGFCTTPGWAEGVALDGQYAHVADGTGLRVADLSGPVQPVEVRFYDTVWTSAQDVPAAGAPVTVRRPVGR